MCGVRILNCYEIRLTVLLKKNFGRISDVFQMTLLYRRRFRQHDLKNLLRLSSLTERTKSKFF